MSKRFEIIKKKNLPNEAVIAGFSFLKEIDDEKAQNKRYDFIETSNKTKIGCMLHKRKSLFSYTRGYVEIDDKPNTFIEAKGRLLILILFLLLGLIGGMVCVYNRSVFPAKEDLPIIGNVDIVDEQQNRPVESKPESEVPTITFSGYGKYTVNEEHPSVEVSNPEINFVDMVFTLTDQDSGEIIARTDRVAAGKYAYVNVKDFYKEPGVYTILINIATYDAETGEQMNGINQKMEVTVE